MGGASGPAFLFWLLIFNLFEVQFLFAINVIFVYIYKAVKIPQKKAC